MSLFANAFRAVALGAVAIVGTISLSAAASAVEEVNITNGAAAHGYDVVAYFTQGRPVKGSYQHTSTYNGATYRFAGAEHKTMFDSDPAKYAPQYGGYCAFGTSMGRKFDGNPNAWRIVDDKLYLNLNQKVQDRWNGNIPGFIKGADNNWRIIESVADVELARNQPDGVTLGAQ